MPIVADMINATALLHQLSISEALRSKFKQEYEDFFSNFGSTLWGADFERWKPQGPLGDFKCDGYLISQKKVFQCYAPEHLQSAKAETKIVDSFDGAKAHFGDRMQNWCFVHNSISGLHGTTNTLLGDLREQYPDITIESWGPETIIRLSKENPIVLEYLFPEVLKNSQLDPSAEDALLEFARSIQESRTNAAQQGALTNQIDLAGALDQLSESDREIRRRIMALCVWYDPVSIERVSDELLELAHSQAAIQSNIERLCEAEFIVSTKQHLLPLNTEICRQAADTLIDEFIKRLD